MTRPGVTLVPDPIEESREFLLWATSRVEGRLRAVGPGRPTDLQHEYLQSQGRLGSHLMDALLKPLSGTSWAYLKAPSGLARDHPRLLRRLPFILAFGHSIGTGIHAGARAVPSSRRLVAETCALLNFGVTLFDRLSDRAEADALQLIDTRLLETLIEYPVAAVRLHDAVAGLPASDTRLLAEIVSDVFARAHRLRPAWDRAQVAFGRKILEGFAAQMASRGATTPCRTESIAKEKSAAPFQIMAALAMLGGAAVSEPELLALAAELGEVFGAADDVADVVEDLATGQVNRILAGEEVRGAAAATVEALADSVAEFALRGERTLQDCVIGYVLDWLRPSAT